jgi:hypothetical protein
MFGELLCELDALLGLGVRVFQRLSLTHGVDSVAYFDYPSTGL